MERKSEAGTSVPLIFAQERHVNHSCSYSNCKNSSMASLDARRCPDWAAAPLKQLHYSIALKWTAAIC